MTAPQRLPISTRIRLVGWLMVFILGWQSAFFPALATLTRGNGVQTRYAYDEQNRLSDLVNTSNAGDLSRFHYALRADGKRTGINGNIVDAPDATTGAARSSVRSLAYTYDNAGKLLSETGQDGLGVAYANTWGYDAVGNRIGATVQKAATAGATTWAHTTSVSAVFNANDQLTSQSSVVDGGTAVAQNFSYDANGAEAGTSSASGTSANGWNFEGKLTQTALADASGNAAGGSANVFDAAGDRLAHTDNLGKTGQKTTSYLVDTDTSYSQVIEERAPDVSDAAGGPALQARYVWGGGLAPLAMWRKMPDGSVKLFFHLSDGQESVRQLTDAQGTVVDSYFYDAWGNTLNGSSNHVANPFRYTGQQLDADGKYYLRARFYSPGNGRFLSHDPLVGEDDDPVSLHRYLYAGADGVNGADPSGLIVDLGSTDYAVSIGQSQNAEEASTDAGAYSRIAQAFRPFTSPSPYPSPVAYTTNPYVLGAAAAPIIIGGGLANALGSHSDTEANEESDEQVEEDDDIEGYETLYHGTTRNKASRILGSNRSGSHPGYGAEGFKGSQVYLAEDIPTATYFAYDTAASSYDKSNPYPVPPSGYSLLSFSIPKRLLKQLGISYADRELIGTRRSLKTPDLYGSTGYERVVDGPRVGLFNQYIFSNVIKVTRRKI